MQTATYRAQHQALLLLSSEVTAASASHDEAASRQLLSKFTGLLRAHLKMEDTYLYPEMLAHHDPNVRARAALFQNEMGQLASAFQSFYDRWSKPGAVGHAPAEYVAAWKEVLGALRNRIQREDDNLYPPFDASANLKFGT